MLPQTVEYGLRAVVWLASCEAPQTTGKIAAATKVPVSYLFKVLQGLSQAGLVSSKRGVRGGYVLAREATEITILDVLDAFEPFRRIDRCPLGVGAHEGALCPLHRRLDAALAHMENAFRETSLADLLIPGEALSPLCTLPRKRRSAGEPRSRSVGSDIVASRLRQDAEPIMLGPGAALPARRSRRRGTEHA